MEFSARRIRFGVSGAFVRMPALSSSTMTDAVDRAGEFIQLFNRVERFLALLVRPEKSLGFVQLVEAA
jgi:hypothetical protein